MVPYGCTKSAAVALHEGLVADLVIRYNAPQVRTICVCPGSTRTHLTDGVNDPSVFLFPWQHSATVAEGIHKKIISGSNEMVFMPEVGWHLGWILRSLPTWWQIMVRNGGGVYTENIKADRLAAKSWVNSDTVFVHIQGLET